MKQVRASVVVIIAAAVLLAGWIAVGGSAKKVFPEDSGASTIDASKYPAEMRDVYGQQFSKRCSKCHTLARPINTRKVLLQSEWEAYTKKMMRKPGSGIKEPERRQIVRFLLYDGRARKSQDYSSKLAAALKAEPDPRKKQVLEDELEEVSLRIRVAELEAQAKAEKSSAKKAQHEQEADRLRGKADEMAQAREKAGS